MARARVVVVALLLLSALTVLPPGQPLLAMAAPPSWQQAQAAFITADQQASVLGATAAGVEPVWQNYLQVLSGYLTQQYDTPAPRLAAALNAPGTFFYVVQDYPTGITRMRVVTGVEGGRKPGPSDAIFAADETDLLSGTARAFQLLLWRGPSGTAQSELVSQRISGGMFPKWKPGIFPADTHPTGVAGWRSSDGSWRCLFILSAINGGSGGNYASLDGYILRPKQSSWVADPTIVPGYIVNGLPHTVSWVIAFTSPTGDQLSVRQYISTIFHEPDCCVQAQVESIWTRVGDHYVPGAWRFIPSPYATLVQVVTISMQQTTCSAARLTGLVASPAVAGKLCAIQWHMPKINGSPDWPALAQRRKPIVVHLTTGGDPASVQLTINYIHGVWVISSVK